MANAKALYSFLESDLNDQGLVAKEEFPGIKPRELAAVAIRKSFMKKFMNGRIVPDRPTSVAILNFIEADFQASKWEPQFNSTVDYQILGDVRLLLDQFWSKGQSFEGAKLKVPCPLFEIRDLYGHLRPGPGASIGAVANDFYTKLFASPLTYSSSSLAFWYRQLIQQNSSWADGENHRRNVHGSADTVVQGSRLSVVPKNDETGRCICTEPSVNMLFQLACGTLLERRLNQVYKIDLSDQPFKNQALARYGSISGSYSTIDLKSASDSLSLRMLEFVLPKSMFNTLLAFRSPETYIPGLGWRQLSIISTMGNGYTFPLQTILFTCIVHAVYRLYGRPLDTRKPNFGVFGDDIVVEVDLDRMVRHALVLFGFRVNMDKSFSEGLFRESCGADFYCGVNVRGFYLKSLSTVQDCYIAINRLNYWSMQTGIQCPKAIKYLLTRCKWLPVPLWESDDAGIKVPYSIVCKDLRNCRFEQSPLYRYFSCRPSDVKAPLDNDQNPSGALVALLNGSIRNGRIAHRNYDVRYRLRWNTAPSWDYPPTTHPMTGWIPWQRWNTSTYLNLYG